MQAQVHAHVLEIDFIGHFRVVSVGTRLVQSADPSQILLRQESPALVRCRLQLTDCCLPIRVLVRGQKLFVDVAPFVRQLGFQYLLELKHGGHRGGSAG